MKNTSRILSVAVCLLTLGLVSQAFALAAPSRFDGTYAMKGKTPKVSQFSGSVVGSSFFGSVTDRSGDSHIISGSVSKGGKIRGWGVDGFVTPSGFMELWLTGGGGKLTVFGQRLVSRACGFTPANLIGMTICLDYDYYSDEIDEDDYFDFFTANLFDNDEDETFYTYAPTTCNNACLVMLFDEYEDGLVATVKLTFTSSTEGTFTFRDTEGCDGSGDFVLKSMEYSKSRK